MVKLREISRTATFAWAPSPQDPMLVTGTKANAIDESFDSTTQLEFWDLNLTDRGADASKLDKSKIRIEVNDRVGDIAWGGYSESKPRGVVATGHDCGGDSPGKLCLWDVKGMMDGSTEPIHSFEQHTGAINALDFNPKQPHILATAGAHGEYFVWDLNKVDSPYAPVNRSTKQQDNLGAIAWNKTAQQIIATASDAGFVHVYDLKNKREVVHLHYPGKQGRAKVSSLSWSAQTSTRIATALNDADNPVVLIWDLRNANAPQAVLEGHSGGVLSVDWCKHDHDLLLSSGLDNKTMLWNPNTGQKLGEYPIATDWTFKASFNEAAPDIFATASFDGKVVVQTLQDTSTPDSDQKKPEGNDFWEATAYTDAQHPSFAMQQAPQWLKRCHSAHFGFGGKIVKVGCVNVGDSKNPVYKSTLDIQKFTGDEGISQETSKFSEGLKGDLSELASKKAEESSSETDKFDWKVLTALLSGGDKRTKLSPFIQSDEVSIEATGLESKKDDPFANSTDDFMEDLPESPSNYVPSGNFSLFASAQNEAEKQITRAVLQGQFEKAVDICLKEDRMTDAFMLALNASDAVKTKVRNSYVSKNADSRPFVRLLNSVTMNDMQDLVDNADVSEWQEIVAGLFTYVKDESKFSELCGKLGDRLLSTKTDDYRNSAVLCYLVGTNLEKSAQIWLREVQQTEKEALESKDATTPYNAHVKALQSFIEKVSVFRRASGDHDFSTDKLEHLYDAYREYANIVASHGNLEVAEQYLNLLPSQYPGVSLEKERVQRATKRGNANTNATRAPAARQPNAAQSIYTPAAPAASAPAPAPAAVPAQPPVPAPAAAAAPTRSPYAPANPVQSSAAPSQPPMAPANPYQPPTNPYAAPANPYQPAQPTASAGYGVPPPPPPPRGANAPLPAGPPPARKEEGGWNDLPAAVSGQAPPPRRSTPGSNTILSPFPGQSASNSPPPPASRGPQAPPPPPKAGQAPPPTSASPAQTPQPQQQQAPPPPPPPPMANNRYAPQSPQPQAPPAMSPPQNGGMMGQTAPNRTASPAVNPYAPSQQQQAPPPPANNPYAPVERSSPQPFAAQAPSGPPPPGPPPAGPASGGPPPPAAQPEEPPAPPPVQRHPKGDRSHIPNNAKPIHDILSAELARVGPLIPSNYTKQVKDVEKRLNILFEHLNNEELLDQETIGDMNRLCEAIQAGDYATATAEHVSILTAKSEQCAQWMPGVKRLIEMSKACQQ